MLPRSDYDPRRVCLDPFPNLKLNLGEHRRSIGVYIAGALFAIGQWIFFDAAVLSAHYHPPPDAPYDSAPVHVTFVDWVPGILTIFGYIIVVLIDKDRIKGGGSLDDPNAVRRARFFLFIGFALMAGGLAGSMTLLVLKYVMPKFPEQFVYYGYANVSQNIAIMLSAVALWFAQGASEYEYNLAI